MLPAETMKTKKDSPSSDRDRPRPRPPSPSKASSGRYSLVDLISDGEDEAEGEEVLPRPSLNRYNRKVDFEEQKEESQKARLGRSFGTATSLVSSVPKSPHRLTWHTFKKPDLTMRRDPFSASPRHVGRTIAGEALERQTDVNRRSPDGSVSLSRSVGPIISGEALKRQTDVKRRLSDWRSSVPRSMGPIDALKVNRRPLGDSGFLSRHVPPSLPSIAPPKKKSDTVDLSQLDSSDEADDGAEDASRNKESQPCKISSASQHKSSLVSGSSSDKEDHSRENASVTQSQPTETSSPSRPKKKLNVPNFNFKVRFSKESQRFESPSYFYLADTSTSPMNKAHSEDRVPTSFHNMRPARRSLLWGDSLISGSQSQSPSINSFRYGNRASRRPDLQNATDLQNARASSQDRQVTKEMEKEMESDSDSDLDWIRSRNNRRQGEKNDKDKNKDEDKDKDKDKNKDKEEDKEEEAEEDHGSTVSFSRSTSFDDLLKGSLPGTREQTPDTSDHGVPTQDGGKEAEEKDEERDEIGESKADKEKKDKEKENKKEEEEEMEKEANEEESVATKASIEAEVEPEIQTEKEETREVSLDAAGKKRKADDMLEATSQFDDDGNSTFVTQPKLVSETAMPEQREESRIIQQNQPQQQQEQPVFKRQRLSHTAQVTVAAATGAVCGAVFGGVAMFACLASLGSSI